jgi:hypothetical protein
LASQKFVWNNALTLGALGGGSGDQWGPGRRWRSTGLRFHQFYRNDQRVRLERRGRERWKWWRGRRWWRGRAHGLAELSRQERHGRSRGGRGRTRWRGRG